MFRMAALGRIPIHVPLLAVVLPVLSCAIANADCGEVVAKLKTRHLGGHSLCELQVRYEAALIQMARKGVTNPKHVGNVYAPRFINMRDWNKYLRRNGDSEMAAWLTYDPKPITWAKWAKTAETLDQPNVRHQFLTGSPENILSRLLELHGEAMSGLLPTNRCGVFRDSVNMIQEIIPLHKQWNAYTVDEVAAIRSAPYKSYQTQGPLVRFVGRYCDNVMPVPASPMPPFQQLFRNNPSNTSEPLKTCGNLYMAPPNEVFEQMTAWATYLSNNLKAIAKTPESVDLIEIAANVQQWFVYIHPFIDGNGRMSRFMMELVFQELNLPLPTLDDMDKDFFSTQDQWADRVGKGMMNTVLAAENCARDPRALGCAVVANAPPIEVK